KGGGNRPVRVSSPVLNVDALISVERRMPKAPLPRGAPDHSKCRARFACAPDVHQYAALNLVRLSFISFITAAGSSPVFCTLADQLACSGSVALRHSSS